MGWRQHEGVARLVRHRRERAVQPQLGPARGHKYRGRDGRGPRRDVEPAAARWLARCSRLSRNIETFVRRALSWSCGERCDREPERLYRNVSETLLDRELPSVRYTACPRGPTRGTGAPRGPAGCPPRDPRHSCSCNLPGRQQCPAATLSRHVTSSHVSQESAYRSRLSTSFPHGADPCAMCQEP